MIKQNTRIKYRILQVLFIAVAGLVIWSCNDELGIDPYRLDIRLDGKDKIVIIPVNPNTKTEYTAEEIINLDYNPYVEEYYIDSQEVVVNVWIQDKPLKAEFFVDKQDVPLITLTEWTESNRPEFTMENNGNGYLATWKTSLEDLGIGLFESQILNIKVTYNDVGQDDWEKPSVKETSYTVYHVEPPVEWVPKPIAYYPVPLEHIIGFWKFDDPENLIEATIGDNLELIGSVEAVAGVYNGDGAAKIGSGSGYNVIHGMPASGGEQVNTYSIVFDVQAPSVGTYVNLLQTDPINSKDGTLYIKPNAGFWLNGLDDSPGDLVQDDTWHRIVAVLDGEAGSFTIYVDGSQVHTVSGVAADSYFAPQLSNFNVFIDDNGEDATINCSNLMLLDIAITEAQVAAFPAITEPVATEITNDVIVGRWNFDDPKDLTEAMVGNDLELIGSVEAVDGVYDGDGATKIGSGSGYSVIHEMPASGGAKVNTYSIVFDVLAPSVGTYVNLLQTDPMNSKDGTLYIKPNAGFWLNGLDDSPGDLVKDDTWHRIVAVLDGEARSFTIYVDGTLVHTVSGVGADSYFAPELSNFNVFIDDNGEDATIICTDLTLFNIALTQDMAEGLLRIDTPVN